MDGEDTVNAIEQIRKEIREDTENAHFRECGYEPLFAAHARASLVIVGHAPGIKAQTAGIPWMDESGKRLMQWLGIDEATFRDETKVAHLPMDFYYQGKGTSGDRPPRRGFAAKWHTKLLAQMPCVELFVLAGQYAQTYYLGKERKKNLTETVKHFEEYLPRYFPIVHPSPLNFRWLRKNPWFEEEVVPQLQRRVATLW